MTDLYAAVIAEIKHNERVYGNDRDPSHRALRAAVEPWEHHGECSPEMCAKAETLRTIAVILGADVALEPAVPSGEASDVQ